MKRKYDMRNKRNFLIILGIAIILIIVFSLFIYKYKHTEKLEYVVSAGSVLQDVNKNFLSIDGGATLKTRWNNSYYLNYQDTKTNLGKNVIVFDSISNWLKLYGRFYEIKSDGKIEQNTGETVLINMADTKFYKIDDREYLLVDKQIVSNDKSINTSNYLLVELDKMGNAKLTNNKLNLKTITNTTLVTSKYTFDIANEILKYHDLEIDLKKIIGTTNQYKEDKKKDEDGAGGEGAGGEGAGTPATPIANQETGNGDGVNVVIDSDDKKFENVTFEELRDKLKMTSIIMFNEGLTTIDIDYVVYDPYNEYKTVFVEIEKPGEVEKIYLSKTDTHMVINNLRADTSYKLNFVYTTIDSETNQLKENKFEEINAKTKKPVYSGKIVKISSYLHKLYYSIDLQKDYPVSSVQAIVTYYYQEADEEGNLTNKMKEETVNIDVASGAQVVNGVIDTTGYDIVDVKNAKIVIKSVSGSNGTINF